MCWRSIGGGHSKEGSDGRVEMCREGLECILLG